MDNILLPYDLSLFLKGRRYYVEFEKQTFGFLSEDHRTLYPYEGKIIINGDNHFAKIYVVKILHHPYGRGSIHHRNVSCTIFKYGIIIINHIENLNQQIWMR